MKKMLVLGLTAFLVITFSSCQFNLFAALDTVSVPSAGDMLKSAAEDASGFLNDVADYLESGAVDSENVDDIVDALETIYDPNISAPEGVSPEDWEETQQEAAVLAGSVVIESDPEAVLIVDNVVSSLTGMADESDSEDMNQDEIISGIFPEVMEEEEFDIMLANFKTAAFAYTAFADTINAGDLDGDGDPDADPDAADWMEGGEAGDMVQYAIVSIMVTSIAADADPGALYAFIYDDSVTTIAGYDDTTEDPFDSDALKVLLDFAGMEF